MFTLSIESSNFWIHVYSYNLISKICQKGRLMGRYCFYCGRKLENDERCNCRYARKNNEQKTESESSQSSSTNDSTNNSSKTENTNSTYNSKSESGAKARNSRFNREKYSAFQESKEEHANRKKKTANKKSKIFNKGKKSEDKKHFSFLQPFRFFKNLFTSPTTVISDSKTAKLWQLFVAVIIQAVLFAFNIFLFVKNSNLSNLIILQDTASRYNGFAKMGMSIFIRAFIFSIILDALRVIIAWIILKLISNQNFNFNDLWKVFLPGIYYSTLIYFISLALINGTGIQGLIIIVFAANLRLLVDIFSIRAWTSFTTDSLIGNTMIIAIIMAIIMSLGINFILPNVAHFSVQPGKNESQAKPNIKVQRSIYDEISL